MLMVVTRFTLGRGRLISSLGRGRGRFMVLTTETQLTGMGRCHPRFKTGIDIYKVDGIVPTTNYIISFQWKNGIIIFYIDI